jgi:ABC-type nitrate/sulfonate/bicarbonate transport system substrate-binding protein
MGDIGSGTHSRRTFLKTAGAATAIGLAGCSGGGGGSGEVPTIRYAGISAAFLNDLNAMFQQSSYIPENVFENRGEEYEWEFVEVQSTPVVVNTLGSDEADAGLLAYSSIANAIQNEAIGSGQSIVAPLTYDGPRYADSYVSTADSDITEVSQLEGGSIGVNGVGSAIDIAARFVLTQNDISPDDVEFREVSFGAMPSTLSEGRVDVGTFIQPFFEMNQDSIQTVFDTTDAFGSFLKIFLTFRDDFLSENGDAVRAYLEDFWTALEWWQDDSNSEQRLDIAEEVIGLPRPLLSELVQTEKGYYHGEDGLAINPEWVQKPVDGMEEVGFLDSGIDMSQYVDNSYLPDAANNEPSIN